jgi:hypothetical protein
MMRYDISNVEILLSQIVFIGWLVDDLIKLVRQ